MIASFKSKPLKRFWMNSDARKLPPQDLEKIDLILVTLDQAEAPEDMDIAGFHFHELRGNQKYRYSVRVNANWRITFAFDHDNDAVDIDFEGYH